MSGVRFFENTLTGAQKQNLSTQQIVFLTTSNSAVATSISGNVATFVGKTILTPPTGFTLDENSFVVYVNGVGINPTHVLIQQVGSDITATFDTTLIGYSINGNDTIIITGKLQ
jgi:hypothetical protein